MKEVVAEKIRGVQWIYFALGIVCIGLLVYFFGFSDNALLQFILSALLIAVIAMCFYSFVLGLKTPKIIATYGEDGELSFREFSCRPREIENVECKFNRGGIFNSSAPDHGTLYVYYKGKRYSYYFVRDLKKSIDRLTELVTADKTIEQFEQEEVNNG
ncbi:MAG: hypothetical protein LUD27_08215 [Clostridia bacterium]|nr:hypothetical protein [Clostridia bacterium]